MRNGFLFVFFSGAITTLLWLLMLGAIIKFGSIYVGQYFLFAGSLSCISNSILYSYAHSFIWCIYEVGFTGFTCLIFCFAKLVLSRRRRAWFL